MKVRTVLVSDSHYEKDAMQNIRRKYPDMDYYIHCGDCMLLPGSPCMEGFLAVCGNMDHPANYPLERSLAIGSHRIWIIHGHRHFRGDNPDYSLLARTAKEKGYNAVFFGHTHRYCDTTVDGVRMLNPGSVWKTRDPSDVSSFMLLDIEDETMHAERVNYVTLLY